jgi:hypothetical protein
MSCCVFELLLIWIDKDRYVQISSIRGLESNAYHMFHIIIGLFEIEKSMMKSDVSKH